jgi:hypothetical protein
MLNIIEELIDLDNYGINWKEEKKDKGKEKEIKKK